MTKFFAILETAAHQDKQLHLTQPEVRFLWRDVINEMEMAYWRGVKAGEDGKRSMINAPKEAKGV